jgi:hypothetical protein
MGAGTRVVSAGKFAGGGSIDPSVLGCSAGTGDPGNLSQSNSNHSVAQGGCIRGASHCHVLWAKMTTNEKNQDIEGPPPRHHFRRFNCPGCCSVIAAAGRHADRRCAVDRSRSRRVNRAASYSATCTSKRGVFLSSNLLCVRTVTSFVIARVVYACGEECVSGRNGG